MIDRGALVLEAALQEGAYRGVCRPALDNWKWNHRGKGRALNERYRDNVLEGDGVIEDLDEALALRDEAHKLGHPGVDVIVFEVPNGPWVPGSLPVATTPPAEGMVLLGWDAFELMEPWWSPLGKGADDIDRSQLNANGLFPGRGAAEEYAARYAGLHPDEEPLVAARIWLVT
ncbi:MAG: hypothetical protein EPO40_20705 [Myxococcaceae bacterium]|nr:MAG: hypothetical protein EPO40_20705 [Myxococcaceae bacterium]